jgi:hypothetical protein
MLMLGMLRLLTVYFGTPNMFITLQFGFFMELTCH